MKGDGGFGGLYTMVPLTSSKMMPKKLIVDGYWLLPNLFDIAANDFGAKKYTRYTQVFVVTELVANGPVVFYMFSYS